MVYDNLVEDNARAGIFFHRSTDYAIAYGNTCRRNAEGDFGIVESMGAEVYNNVMEVSCGMLEVYCIKVLGVAIRGVKRFA